MVTAQLLNTAEAAKYLGYKDPSTIRQLLAAGKLPGARKPGRDWMIPRTDLDRVRSAGQQTTRAQAERLSALRSMDEDETEVVALFKDGVPLSALASALGMSRQGVWYRIQRHQERHPARARRG